MAEIALVTGSSRGIGKGMALSLAEKGFDVILTYHSKKDEAESVADEIRKKGRRVAVVQYSAEDIASLDPFVSNVVNILKSEFNTDKLNHLVHNAGVGAVAKIEEVSESDFDQMNNIHYKSVFFLTQKLLPHLADNGSVITVSSGTTRFNVPGYSVYSSLKAAVETFTKFIAQEYGSRGIRANVIAPGPVVTDFNGGLIHKSEYKSFLSSLSPLNRVGEVEDIGPVVAFLCTNEARWINGQRLEISGGINL